MPDRPPPVSITAYPDGPLIVRGDVDIVDNLTPEANEALAENPDLFVDRSYSAEVDYLCVAGGDLCAAAQHQLSPPARDQ